MRHMLTTGLSICAMVAISLTTLTHAAPLGAAAFVDAAMNGNRDAVRSLLKDGADVNTTQADGMTALHWAAQKGDVELAKMLLYASANLQATTRIGGYTPLLIASKNGDAPMIDTLATAGADANATTINGTTPLMLAAAAGKPAAVKALLAHGANVNAREAVKGESALTFAAAFGRADVIRVLTAAGADVKTTTNAVDLAGFAKEEQERLAAERGGGNNGAQAGRGNAPAGGRGGAPQGPQIAGVNRQYNYTELVGFWGGLAPMHLAARQGELESVKALIEAGAEVNQRGTGDPITPLLIATVNGHFDLAKYLLDQGADPNLAQSNGVASLYAALNCQWAAKALYPQPRAYEQQHTTYLDLMQALLDKGADPNARLTKKVWYAQ
ncbi:MAG: hypothetical protein JWL71_3839, partial [Acidobacteria bacterium]|nr:hypothetical protein [Acidobacteriota bacterium]